LKIFLLVNFKKFETSEHKSNFGFFDPNDLNQMLEQEMEKNSIKQKINEKLSNTGITFDSLEKMYNNDTKFHIVFDLKGTAIWFNISFMELTGRKENEFLNTNFVENLFKLNSQHPLADLFVRILQEQPKYYKCLFFILLIFLKQNLRKFFFLTRNCLVSLRKWKG
jgi:hypothetical protein